MSGGRVSILSYHSVAPRRRQALPGLAVRPEDFAQQMAALREQDVELIAFCDVPAALAEGRTAVAVTIDDGFADAAAYACPVLAELDIPATLFLPSGYVGGRARWLPGGDGRRPLMGWSTVRQLADAGFEIGSHGRMHLAADVNAPQVVAHDAMISRHELEQGIGRPVQSFAYPYGFHSGAARRAVRQAGYAQACAVGDLPALTGDDRFALPRLQVETHTTPEDLLALITWRPGSSQRAWARSKQSVWRLGRRWRNWGPVEANRLHEVVQSAPAPGRDRHPRSAGPGTAAHPGTHARLTAAVTARLPTAGGAVPMALTRPEQLHRLVDSLALLNRPGPG